MSLQGNYDKVVGSRTHMRVMHTTRHPSTQHMLRVLAPNPNLTGRLHDIAFKFWDIATVIVEDTPDSPELTAGLRKLLEAKDCFIRAALDNEPVDYRDR